MTIGNISYAGAAFDLQGATEVNAALVSTLGVRSPLSFEITAYNELSAVSDGSLSAGKYAIEVSCKGADGKSYRMKSPGAVIEVSSSTTPSTGTTSVRVAGDEWELTADVEMHEGQARTYMSLLEDARKAAMDAKDNVDSVTAKANDALTLATEAKATADAQARTLTETNASIVESEQARAAAEESRVSAETARTTAETERENAEQARQTAENERSKAETERLNAEQARKEAENARKEAESAREAEETSRDAAEAKRASAETERASAEKARAAAETERKAAETQRTDAETQRETAFLSAKEACQTATSNANAAADKANAATANANSATEAATEAEAERQDAEDARKEAEQRRETAFELSKSAAETAISNANAAAEKANTEAEKAKAVVEDYKQNTHEHLTIILTTDNNNDGALKGAIVSIKYQNSNMETARVDTLTWEGDPLKTDITAGMMYTVSTSKVSGYDFVRRLENVTAIGGYDRSVTLRYANAADRETCGQVFINPASGSATLHRENVETLNASLAEYRSKGFPCVMDAKGLRMAKIKSATFEGNYVTGMTEGTVTFMDGTICDINTLNNKGCNWMVYRPELFFSSWVNDIGDEILSFGGNLKVTGGHSFKEKYVGMFKAFNQDGVLKSQPNRIPTSNETIATFQQQAEAGGNGYCLWSYKDWCKENALHLALFGNTNYEVNVGTGRINNYDNVRNIVTGFTLPLVGTEQNYGTRATLDSEGNSVNCLNFLDIEGLGEQIWEFVIGYRHDEGTIYIWDDDTWSESHNADYTVPYSVNNANSSYVRQMVAGEHFDMIPRLVGGSSVTGYCDGCWANTNRRLLFVGGDAYSGSICGLSASASNYGFGDAYGGLGARLAFYSTPVTVSGAELVASLG